jgi:23S rRNA pseudouridine2457 synthase
LVVKKNYYLVHKPYGMLSQFSDAGGRATLKKLSRFPRNVYPVGRLDMDSEGLLLLTDDKMVTANLLEPRYRHEREYIVLVQGVPDESSLRTLEAGVLIEGKMTLPAKAQAIARPDWVEERVPELRLKPSIIHSWMSITIIEGRNRQVRKMTASIGCPTLRLIRCRIANLTIDGLLTGMTRMLTDEEVLQLRREIDIAMDRKADEP